MSRVLLRVNKLGCCKKQGKAFLFSYLIGYGYVLCFVLESRDRPSNDFHRQIHACPCLGEGILHQVSPSYLSAVLHPCATINISQIHRGSSFSTEAEDVKGLPARPQKQGSIKSTPTLNGFCLYLSPKTSTLLREMV